MESETNEGAASTTQTDAEVISSILRGNTALFEILLRRYNQRLYRVARSIVGDPAEAEDVVQAAWAQAYANLSQYAGAALFATWASTIAANEALRRLRERARFVPISRETNRVPKRPADRAHRDDPEQRAYRDEVHRALEAAIDALPPEYRSVFVLRCVERMKVAETAQVLGLTEDVVKTRLHRARGMLQRFLGKRLGEIPPDLYRFRGFRCDRMVSNDFRSIRRAAA
jgi:RNA polymerase sigma-70 factor (ECF subfamily)